MTKRLAESPINKQDNKRFRSDHFHVGSRIQVLWEMHTPETGAFDLVYFSALVKAKASQDGNYVLLYDEVKGYSDSQECEVKLIDDHTIFDVKENSEQKWRREASGETSICRLDRDAFCPLGHVLARDLTNESIRICDCCLSAYYTTNGQWECTADSSCQDWGACDNCLDDYLKTGAWTFCDDVDEEQEIVDIRDCVADIENAVIDEAEDSLKEVMGKLPFAMQSNLAYAYREFVDVMSSGIRELANEKGAGYVVTAEDVKRIASRLSREN